MKVKIKKLNPNAVIPYSKNFDDAGKDLVAISKSFDSDGNAVYGTGLAFEIPIGYVGLLFPRSSNSTKDLILSNSVGVIDSGYRGEVMLKYKCIYNELVDKPSEYYNTGDRVGQIIIISKPDIEFEEVEELSNTDRGEGGYGSTGE